MSETVITVQGSASTKHAPEQATVTITVSNDGPSRDAVFADTTKVSETIATALAGLLDNESGHVVA